MVNGKRKRGGSTSCIRKRTSVNRFVGFVYGLTYVTTGTAMVWGPFYLTIAGDLPSFMPRESNAESAEFRE